jgi:hypothetical protein
VQEPVDRLPRRNNRRQGNDHDDEEAGEIFRATEPVVYRRFAARRPRMNATHSGIAVRASEKLCTVSANKATEPLNRNTTACRIVVTNRITRLITNARTPS